MPRKELFDKIFLVMGNLISLLKVLNSGTISKLGIVKSVFAPDYFWFYFRVNALLPGIPTNITASKINLKISNQYQFESNIYLLKFVLLMPLVFYK